MKRLIINTIIILFALLFIVTLFLGNIWYKSVPIASNPGSYAEDYAREHRLESLKISDSLEHSFDIRYESFEYNVDTDGIVIEKYTGKSTALVIPQSIMGISVSAIGESFWDSCSNVSELYLPLSVTSLEGNPVSDITLYVDSHSNLAVDLADTDWVISSVNDSEYLSINFDLGDNPFIYNLDGSGVDITGYTGEEKIIVFPSHINGNPVTKISMDMLNYKGVVIPDTVNEITGATYKYSFDAPLLIGIAFSFIAFLSTLVTVNKIIPGKQNSSSVIAPAIAGQTILFLLVVLVVNAYILISENLYSALWVLLINLVVLVVYIVLISLTSSGKRHIALTEATQAIITDSVKDIKALASSLNLDMITDQTQKGKAKRVVDDIKYIPPSTSEDVNKIDSQLINQLDILNNFINANNEDGVNSSVRDIEDLLRKRAVLAKKH